MEQAKKTDKTSSIYKFFNNPIPIIVTLIIFSICLMIYNRHIINSTSLYTFSGFNDTITIVNGTIYTGYNINYFADSKVIYTGENIRMKNYSMGYYLKNDNSYIEITSVNSNNELEGSASLKSIVETVDFSFTEVKKDAFHLSKKNIANLDNLVFKIVGTDNSNNQISIEIPLIMTKISK